MGDSCKDCRGSGKYQGLLTVSACSRCNGTGIEPSGPPVAVYSGEVVPVERAEKIMGKMMFFGVGNARRHFSLDDARSRVLSAGVPCSEGFLEGSRDNGFVLLADAGNSILDVRQRVSYLGDVFHNQDWYDAEDFALKTVAPAWRLLSAEAFPGSFGMDLPAQQGMVSQAGLVIPEAREVAYAAIGMFLATVVRLFEDYHVRTSSADSFGAPVLVGRFDGSGLDVYSDWYDRSDVGVSFALSCPARSSE